MKCPAAEMSEVREVNVVDQLLALIAYTRAGVERDIDDAEEGSEQVAHFRDMMQTVVGELCRILSSLLAAPVNAKLLVRLPVETTPPEEQAQSIETHLVSKWKGVPSDAA